MNTSKEKINYNKLFVLAGYTIGFTEDSSFVSNNLFVLLTRAFLSFDKCKYHTWYSFGISATRANQKNVTFGSQWTRKLAQYLLATVYTGALELLCHYVPGWAFASIVWWSRTLRKTDHTKLDRLQGRSLRGITATGRSTSWSVMRAMLDLPLLALHTRTEAMKIANRLDCVGGWITNRKRHKLLFRNVPRKLCRDTQDEILTLAIRNVRYKIHFSERKV